MEENNIYYYEEELSLSRLYNIIKKNLGIIITVTCGMALLALLISVTLNSIKEPKPIYRAVKKVEVVINDIVINDQEDKDQLIRVVVELIKGDSIVKKAMDKANVIGEIEDVRKNIEVKRIADTNIIEIIVNNENQAKARALADEIILQWASLVKDIFPLERFKVVQEVMVSNDVVKADAGANIILNIFVGSVFGFLGIIFVIFMKRALNEKIASEEDVRRYLRLKVLVSIPNKAYVPTIKRYLKIK